MPSEIKIIRLSTGEDVIAKVDEGSGETVELKNPLLLFHNNQHQDNQYN